MKKYAVKANKHDFKPTTFDQIYPVSNVKGFLLECTFDRSCLEDNPPAQWNKVGGITSFITFRSKAQNNSNSQIGVYQAMKNSEGILFNSYVNFIDTSFKFDNSLAIQVEPEELVTMEARILKYSDIMENTIGLTDTTQYVCSFTYGTKSTEQSALFAIDNPPCMYRKIGAYYGGRIKSDKKRSLKMSLNYIK